MRRTLLLAALLAIPMTAIAQQEAVPAAPTTPDEFVKARQQNMARGGGAMAAMKQAIDSGADLTTLAPRIEWLTGWSQRLPTLFPAGSDTAASGARPEVWSAPSDFAAAGAHFSEAVRGLAAPAAANDHGAFAAAWSAVRAACGACHDHFKQ